VAQQSAPSAAAPPVRLRRAAARAGRARPAVLTRIAGAPTALSLALTLAAAALLRLWQLNHVGFNSDGVVYSGQGTAIANDRQLAPFIPIFRAHPLLFQTGLSLGFRIHLGEGFERVAAAAFGVAAVYLVYELARLLYGRRVGLIAALVMALVPYRVLFSRQVLLDGPMTFFATLLLWLLARFESSGRRAWLNAAAAAMGLTLLTNETNILLLGAAYASFALTPQLRVRLHDLAMSVAVTALVILPLASIAFGVRRRRVRFVGAGTPNLVGNARRLRCRGDSQQLRHRPHPLGALDAARAARAHSPACSHSATG
jgi:predicted membrane-bound mannosyltransferase